MNIWLYVRPLLCTNTVTSKFALKLLNGKRDFTDKWRKLNFQSFPGCGIVLVTTYGDSTVLTSIAELRRRD